MKPQSTFVLAPWVTGRVFRSIGDDSAARGLVARWSDYLARRREARESVAVAEMSPHMLKDIGAPSWMISRAAERAPTGTAAAARLPVSLLVATLVVLPALGSAGEGIAGEPSVNLTAQAQAAAVFTGKRIDGVPVYRLPSVAVRADRSVELARIEREERLAHAKQKARARRAA